MGNIILTIIFSVSVTIFCYETYYEKKEKKIGRLLAPKVEELIEKSSLEISRREKRLNRELTDAEKNMIVDECYSRI